LTLVRGGLMIEYRERYAGPRTTARDRRRPVVNWTSRVDIDLDTSDVNWEWVRKEMAGFMALSFVCQVGLPTTP